MKKTLSLIAISLLLAGRTSAQDRDVLVKIGDGAPDFEVQLFDGEKLATRALRGRVVLLNFWATWNPPCLEEFKRVPAEIIERFEGKPFAYLAISREDTRDQVKAFREKTGYRFPMGLDPGREIFSKFAAASIPRDFVIDRAGKIVYMTSGYTEKGFSEMIRVIEKLLE
ncbi:MAG: TlpA family protein disulfide reductase [Odoribacteraceae bacterium]|jgi:peroxiredoxin|nr:TlpA family protein disulfide reductase [Odoribacteraceae bacterium]